MNQDNDYIRPEWEYSFPPVSDKMLEGYPENYTWTAKYIRFRKYHCPLTDQEIDQKLIELKQPYGRVANGFRGALLGLAVGDALGTANEFKIAGSFEPIKNMMGGGPFDLQPGEWTDDTSMAYALGQSLIYRNAFDPKDQMDKYLRWFRHGAFSSTGKCFDIGNTVRQALERYEATGEPYMGSDDPRSAGNGALMRLAPVVLFFFNDIKETIHFAGESSKTTHGAFEAISACRYFSTLLHAAISGLKKSEFLSENYEPYKSVWNDFALAETVLKIRKASYLRKSVKELSPTGYVIDTLESALWCFAKTDNFNEGALLAANLGGDADTIAAVYGQIAGAYYGEPNINAQWIQTLDRQYIFFIQAQKMLLHSKLG
jgi:ADP-ribosylglycohydrolase